MKNTDKSSDNHNNKSRRKLKQIEKGLATTASQRS